MATTTRPAERTAPHRSRRRTPATRTARGDMQRLLGAMVATERRRLGLILVACLFCWYVVLPMLLAGSRSGASITSSPAGAAPATRSAVSTPAARARLAVVPSPEDVNAPTAARDAG